MAQRLLGKVTIITGAASGIGAGTAQLFAEEGARLILIDRDEDGLKAIRQELLRISSQVETVEGDVAQASTAAAAATLALDRFGQIDLLFNNAGVMNSGEFGDLTEDGWDMLLNINLKGMYHFCHAVIPHMLKRGSGSIINTSSVMASLTEPGYEAYTTSKAGIIGLTKALAVSYAEQGIRVNAICPGWVDTPMNQRLAEELGGIEHLVPIIKRQQPLPRMISAREIGYAVLFLASDESQAITGIALPIDGAASAAV